MWMSPMGCVLWPRPAARVQNIRFSTQRIGALVGILLDRLLDAAVVMNHPARVGIRWVGVGSDEGLFRRGPVSRISEHS